MFADRADTHGLSWTCVVDTPVVCLLCRLLWQELYLEVMCWDMGSLALGQGLGVNCKLPWTSVWLLPTCHRLKQTWQIRID